MQVGVCCLKKPIKTDSLALSPSSWCGLGFSKVLRSFLLIVLNVED